MKYIVPTRKPHRQCSTHYSVWLGTISTFTKRPFSQISTRGRIAIAILAATLVAFMLVLGLSWIGQWLVIADPLEPAQAAVVFGGHLPFRAMEAAALFQKGLAKEVWLTKGAVHEEEVALMRLGIQTIPEQEYSRQVLVRLGVPSASILLLEGAVDNTAEEVALVSHEAQRTGTQRVILITSKYHTRRVRYVWKKLVGDHPQAIVRYTSSDPFNPKGWWRHSRDAMAVSREVFGMLNAWAGFPMPSS